ncbi:hypothetical protein PX554_17810 [Sphingomonas sp. H39-1-10]|uniref:hypothetical protein n=1 Tax=Sphingomonas TaxID=13687 RepID=UPI00088C11FA|nr:MULTISPECIES: hypothetical protein [Sphingomonas]MDF0489994.1 hypothetical protein [Sphingomonas pollutisoli]SDA36219.1 hypothetical protein SAMN03159340_03573 [Sphingomonas sp. NFR15]
MSFLGGITNVFTNPANLAMLATGPTGWAALAVKTLASSIGQQVIQQLGQQLGLPQSTIDLAQGAFAGAMGDQAGAFQNVQEAVSGFSDAFGGSPAQEGDLQRTINDSINDMAVDLGKQGEKVANKGGWLMAIAEALGKQLNGMAQDMNDMAGKISKDTPDITTKFSALSQQFSILFNAASTALKSIGEGMSSTARKQ